MLVWGSWAPEFQPVLELLAAETNLHCGAAPAPGDGALDLEILLTPRPIGFASPGFDQDTSNQETQPAQRLLLLGSWCEGSRRVPSAEGLVERIYWHEFPAWWGSNTGASCPPSGWIEVAADDYQSAANAIDTLAEIGYHAFWRVPGRGGPYATPPTAGLWIGGQLDGHQSRRLAAFAAPYRRAGKPLVVALDFPRGDELETLQRIGATALVGKPWTAASLQAALLVQPNPCGSGLPYATSKALHQAA